MGGGRDPEPAPHCPEGCQPDLPMSRKKILYVKSTQFSRMATKSKLKELFLSQQGKYNRSSSQSPPPGPGRTSAIYKSPSHTPLQHLLGVGSQPPVRSLQKAFVSTTSIHFHSTAWEGMLLGRRMKTPRAEDLESSKGREGLKRGNSLKGFKRILLDIV